MITPRFVVNIRGWPGVRAWKPPPPTPVYADRLGDRVSLVIAVAALSGSMPESFGLGAVRVVSGSTVLHGVLLVPDECDRNVRRSIGRWARRHVLGTCMGPRPWRVATLSEFCDPRASVKASPWAFAPRAYTGRGFVVGVELGRVFGLMADHCIGRRGSDADNWELWLPGWGVRRSTGIRRSSPHRPSLWLSARRVGWRVRFAPCGSVRGEPAGKRVQGKPWQGSFVDCLSLAYGLDADRGASYAEHRENFGLEPLEMPLVTTVDPAGAEQMAATARGIHEFALVLDEHASRWFTSPQDRREGRGRLDIARTASPAAIAAHIPARLGLRPPLEQFDLTDAEHEAWCEAFHGGWVDG
jgi:hypothetical protein